MLAAHIGFIAAVETTGTGISGDVVGRIVTLVSIVLGAMVAAKGFGAVKKSDRKTDETMQENVNILDGFLLVSLGLALMIGGYFSHVLGLWSWLMGA